MSEDASDRRTDRLERRLQRAALALTAALSLLVAAWVLWPTPTAARAAGALLLAAPLLLAIRGLSAGDRRTFAWLTLAVVPYVVLAIMEAVANVEARAFAVLAGFAAFSLFVVLIARLRVQR